MPLYDYTAATTAVHNITDWALAHSRHADRITQHVSTKQAIFHYVYSVLHHPRTGPEYERNLKRELPRHPVLR